MDNGDTGEAHGADQSEAHGAHGGYEHRGFKETFGLPFLIPVGSALAIFVIILSVSQILLVVSESAATAIALFIALVVLFSCAYFATARTLNRQIVLAGVAVPFIVLFVAGIASGIYRQTHAESDNKGSAEALAASASGGNQSAKPAPEVTTDNKYSVTSYQVQANSPVVVTVRNDAKTVHNMHILGITGATGQDVKTDLLQPGQSADLSFTIAQEGTYNFQCDVHPTEMKGTVTVAASNTAAGAATAAGGPGAGGGLSETTTDNKFSQTSLTADKGVSAAITVQNKGAAIHNWHVLNAKKPDGSDIKTDLLPAGQSATITFQIDQPGTYDFQCDVHPTEMKGKLTIK
jgi:plastocyanin